jgi:Bacterial PH domain
MNALDLGEYEYEPIPGLPQRLPVDERILWQGAPEWQTLARRAFHVRKLAAYFIALLIWRFASALLDGETLTIAGLSALWIIVLAAISIGLFAGVSWLIARTSVYTITNRRVVMRFGIALPMTFNLPFSTVQGATLRRYPNGCGDIPLALSGNDRIAYPVLWPHARPWQFTNPQPMLRAIANADRVARILADAVAESADTSPALSQAAQHAVQQPARPAITKLRIPSQLVTT